ncbi:MAG TPA: phage tail assembly chaperone [Novosphingobium sp.]|nr:phage tail assembly chaperone [Novosphingobium sp.]
MSGQAGEPALFGAHARALMGLAARQLGWRPAEFWAATPEELAACLHSDGLAPDGPAPAPGPLTRAEFDLLRERDR